MTVTFWYVVTWIEGLAQLRWRHNGRDGVSNHQLHDLFTQPCIRAQINENMKVPRHWPLRGEFTGEFPAQRVSNAENVSIWWRHHAAADLIENYYDRYVPLPDDYEIDEGCQNMRNNQDKTINTNGRQLLDVCKMNNLCILNGRVGDDAGIGEPVISIMGIVQLTLYFVRRL